MGINNSEKSEGNAKENNDILSDKWIFFRYQLDLYRPDNKSHEEFLEYCENLKLKILEVSMNQMLFADSEEKREGWFKKSYVYKGSLNKTLTSVVYFEEDMSLYTILLRFNEVTEEHQKEWKNTGGGIRLKSDDESREYNFSPTQFMKIIPITHSIEFALMTTFGFKQIDEFTQNEQMLMAFEYDKTKTIPWITETDGIGYFTYPFEKRVQLYQEYPDVEKELFKPWKFKNFINWIYSKKNKSEYDKQFCLDVENILKRYNFEI